MSNLSNFKAGYAAILGKPNVGKSTLLNQVLDFDLSIVTPKPQTTRKKVIGILNSETFQVIFIDTPGIIEPRYSLQKIMMRYIRTAMEDADVLLYMVDASETHPDYMVDASETHPEREEMKVGVEKQDKPMILLINKIDLIQKDRILPLIETYKKIYPFKEIIPVSALNKDGMDQTVQEVVRLLPQNPPYYPSDYVTDQQERFFVAEIIREKVFLRYGEEIPYSTHVDIEEFREREGRKDYIRAAIYVEKNSQKGILIGREGRALKKVGELARKEMETFLNRPVFLELFVKVSENWRRKDDTLRELGY
jgi:GTP-binding protein Era